MRVFQHCSRTFEVLLEMSRIRWSRVLYYAHVFRRYVVHAALATDDNDGAGMNRLQLIISLELLVCAFCCQTIRRIIRLYFGGEKGLNIGT